MSSHGESTSTLAFGSRVSEVTLGQAKKNSESAQIFEAKDQVIRYAEITDEGHRVQVLTGSSGHVLYTSKSSQDLISVFIVSSDIMNFCQIMMSETRGLMGPCT